MPFSTMNTLCNVLLIFAYMRLRTYVLDDILVSVHTADLHLSTIQIYFFIIPLVKSIILACRLPLLP